MLEHKQIIFLISTKVIYYRTTYRNLYSLVPSNWMAKNMESATKSKINDDIHNEYNKIVLVYILIFSFHLLYLKY